MVIAYFLEDKNVLLSQFRKHLPSVGEEVTIKGRKGKVSNISIMDENKVEVHVVLDKLTKHKVIVDDSKKKRR